MVKTSTVAVLVLIAFCIGCVIGVVGARKYRPCVNLPISVQRDTITVRDTLRDIVPVPVKERIIRVDTVRLEITPGATDAKPIDTVRGDDTIEASEEPRIGQGGTVEIPISQRVYATEFYRAVVSGWRPSLDSIEVYRKTQTITNTVTQYKPPRIALLAGGGVGYTTDKKIVPFVGLALGLVLWSK